MNSFGTYEAKARFTDLLKRVQAGEQIVITRHGEPVARLVPVGKRQSRRSGIDVVERFRRIRTAVAKRGGMKGTSIKALVREGRRF